MSFFVPMPGTSKIVPDGEYLVVLDNKLLGKLKTLDEAQKFQSTLGRPGSRIIIPNVRAKMTEDQIGRAQKTLDDWGKWDAWKR